MKLHEKIYQLRKQSGMSQEEAADKLKISRQSLSRWENGSAQPAAGNIAEISRLFGVTTDYLLNDSDRDENNVPAAAEIKKVNSVRRANLTRIAIVVQVCMLNIVIQPTDGDIPHVVALWFRGIGLMLLLAATIWMASNHRYETNPKQRAKNTKIEMAYCCIQAAIALTAYFTHFYFLGAVLLIVVSLLYLLKINPKYMNRKFTK